MLGFIERFILHLQGLSYYFSPLPCEYRWNTMICFQILNKSYFSETNSNLFCYSFTCHLICALTLCLELLHECL
jgi:hypothetical protein